MKIIAAIPAKERKKSVITCVGKREIKRDVYKDRYDESGNMQRAEHRSPKYFRHNYLLEIYIFIYGIILSQKSVIVNKIKNYLSNYKKT